MKKILMVLALIFLCVSPIQTQAQLRKIFQPKFQVGGSFEEFRGKNMVVVNNTPYWALITVYEKDIAIIGPGDTLYDNRHFAFPTEMVPVIARFYRCENDEYIGAAGYIFSISGYSPMSFEWKLMTSQIQLADGQKTCPENPSRHLPRTIKAKFPNKHSMGTTALQILNNTPYQALVRINGANPTKKGAVVLNKSGFFYLQSNQWLSTYGKYFTVQLIFMDKEKFIGTASYQFYAYGQNNGVYAYQFIAGENNVQR